MRIIAGKNRGLVLKSPAGQLTRPTLSRIRESLFNIIGYPCSGSFLDLYAGTGSIGLEAYSRGCSKVVLVESDKKVASVLEQNIEKCDKEKNGCKLIIGDALMSAKRMLGCERYDIVFLDPPYEQTILDKWHESIQLDKLINENGKLIIQHDKNAELATEWCRCVLEDRRFYGETGLSFYSVATGLEDQNK